MQVDAAQPAGSRPEVAAQPGPSRVPAASPEPSPSGPPISSGRGQPGGAFNSRQVSISVDQSQVWVYRILDGKTGDLIQQIPPEEVLRIVRGIQEML